MGDPIDDERFVGVLSDPKFRNVPRAQRKVKIDKRFRSMFTDKRFRLKYTVDKRGRPINETQTENFRKYYDLSSGDEETDSSDDDEEDGKGENAKEPEIKDGERVEEESKDSGSTVIKESVEDDFKEHLMTKTKQGSDLEDETDALDEAKIDNKIQSRLEDMSLDYARGVGVLQSDDSSSDESSSEESETENIEHNWGELDKNAEVTEEATRRFAVCHMDWDRISATDIMVLFQSFLPAGGIIESVTIYPSEFGLERMKEEEVSGPKELVENKGTNRKFNSDENGLDENSEGDSYHREKLRLYQLNRLKYYYAVVVCDSAETANKLYTECDSMEYESSATKLDMRFIPDDMTFDQEPKDVCTSVPDLTKYTPRLFANSALQQIKVDLTWDETDPNRIEFNKKIIAGQDLPQDDLKAYIATSSEEEESDKEENAKEAGTSDDDSTCGDGKDIEKYRALLANVQDTKKNKEMKDVEMEITWGVSLSDQTKKIVDEKSKSELTPFEKLVEKKKEKRKQRKAKLKPDKDDDNLCSDDDIPSDVDLNDEFFKRGPVSGKKKGQKDIDKDSEDGNESDKQKEELELLLAEDENEKGKSHFSLKDIQERENMSKRKKKQWRKKKGDNVQEDNFKVDVKDKRFSAIYDSHLFNIDPADPHFRKTKGMEEIIMEKLKRKQSPDEKNTQQPTKKTKMNPELSRLVKSVKQKNIRRKPTFTVK